MKTIIEVHGTPSEIAEVLRIVKIATNKPVLSIPARKNKQWTRQEDAILKAHYKNKTRQQLRKEHTINNLSTLLQRPRTAIINRVFTLKIGNKYQKVYKPTTTVLENMKFITETKKHAQRHNH